MRLIRISQHFASQSSKLVSLIHQPQRKVSFIKMTNPTKRNPLSLEALSLLSSAFTQVQQQVRNKQTKIVILEGQGTVFSSGHDLKQLAKLENPQIIFDQCAKLMKQIRQFPTPVVCVVNGIAAAAGFQMTMACDIIIASQKSVFYCPGINLGLFCSTPGVELVRSISSQKKANQLLFFGEQFTASQAYRLGIVNKVVPESQLKQTIDSYIQKSSKLSGQVITFGKQILIAQRKLPIDQAYKLANKAMSDNILLKQDCQQGIKAFLEKRAPQFKN